MDDHTIEEISHELGTRARQSLASVINRIKILLPTLPDDREGPLNISTIHLREIIRLLDRIRATVAPGDAPYSRD